MREERTKNVRKFIREEKRTSLSYMPSDPAYSSKRSLVFDQSDQHLFLLEKFGGGGGGRKVQGEKKKGREIIPTFKQIRQQDGDLARTRFSYKRKNKNVVPGGDSIIMSASTYSLRQRTEQGNGENQNLEYEASTLIMLTSINTPFSLISFLN